MTGRRFVCGLPIRNDEGRALSCARAVFLPCSDVYIIYNFLVWSAREKERREREEASQAHLMIWHLAEGRSGASGLPEDRGKCGKMDGHVRARFMIHFIVFYPSVRTKVLTKLVTSERVAPIKRGGKKIERIVSLQLRALSLCLFSKRARIKSYHFYTFVEYMLLHSA